MSNHFAIAEIEAGRQRNLSRKQRVVYDFLLNNQVAAANLTLEELAAELSVSVSTIIRLSKELGYDGFGELKRELRQDFLRTLAPLEQFDDRTSATVDHDLVTAQLKRDQENLKELAESVGTEEIVALAQRIVSARRTLVVSTGSYGIVGQMLSHHGKFMGHDVRFEERGSSFLAHELANLLPGDLLVTVSFWRDSHHLLAAAQAAGRSGVPTVMIGGSRSSRLAKQSDSVLIVPSESTAFYQSMVAGLALVYAVINAIWQLSETKASRTAANAQALYPTLGVLPPEIGEEK